MILLSYDRASYGASHLLRYLSIVPASLLFIDSELLLNEQLIYTLYLETQFFFMAGCCDRSIVRTNPLSDCLGTLAYDLGCFPLDSGS